MTNDNFNKDWFYYCKGIGVNPYDEKLKEDEYHIKGFEEWKRLQKEFRYYNYMITNS